MSNSDPQLSAGSETARELGERIVAETERLLELEAAFLVSLTSNGLSADVLELLTYGDAKRGIPPRLIQKAIKPCLAAEKALLEAQKCIARETARCIRLDPVLEAAATLLAEIERVPGGYDYRPYFQLRCRSQLSEPDAAVFNLAKAVAEADGALPELFKKLYPRTAK